MKKMCFCPVALAAALLVALFLASCSNAPGNPPNVDPMPGIGTPTIPTPVTPGREIMQSAHAKVYKVPGGLMFKITRPTEDVFNPQKVVKEEAFNDYSWVGDGKGSYSGSLEYVGDGNGDLKMKNVHVYAGQGNGSHKLIGKSHYKEVWRNGNYRIVEKYVGEGNGYYACVVKNVGQGNGSFKLIGKNHYKYVGSAGNLYRSAMPVGEGNGDYKYLYKYVGSGKGNYKLEDGEYKLDISGNGSYIYSLEYVGEGSGNYKVEYVSVPSQGSYVYTDELVDEFVMASPGDGSYMPSFEYVGQGNGDIKYEYESSEQGTYVYTDELVDEYVPVGVGNGDYDYYWTTVKDKNGDYKYVYTYVGPGNGGYEYKDTIKTYGGWNYVQISNGNCRASVDLANSADKNELSCFWPLCEPGKLCEYEILMEPYDGNLRDSVIAETLVVAADEGLGGIKEATIDNITMTYVGNKLQVKIDGLTAFYDNMVNPRSSFDFFATNQSQLKADGSPDFDTNYACQWFGYGTADGIQNDFVWNIGCRSWDPRDFDQIFDDTQKDSVYLDCSIRFDVPSSSGFETWRNYPKGGKSLLKIR